MSFKILIVDDEPALQNMVGEILVRAGYEIQGALSCAQALERFRTAAPDAVLLDVMLPDGDGFPSSGSCGRYGMFRCCSSPPGTRTRPGSGAWAWERTTTSQNPSFPRSCCCG